MAPLVSGCDDSDDDKMGTSKGALCVTFVDRAMEDYALVVWDKDRDGCVSKSEAAAVTEIPAFAFTGNKNLRSIDDLNQFANLKSIGDAAFAGCTGLTSVNLMNVTSVGRNAFLGCKGLVDAEIPNATIPNDAFVGCPSLKNNPVVPVPGCPASCPNDCDANGVCNTHTVTCPASCPNDCDANGVCNAHTVTCPDTCPNDCDANGVCNIHGLCPAECHDSCGANGLCQYPGQCPKACPNNCTEKGVCLSQLECPMYCEFGCDGAGNCNFTGYAYTAD